ncbi:hypothetical protein [Alloactinosynnema sp. L-07]|uniref:hypothetical protein n=1 Tax=Alloactinosynnema sp. L-07 TaxID=1653480 RepID=UPI00065EF3FE|nr:hypothetical protein [Alloactinosynnema sp. L-07]CRK59088.1 hypothetical protein [Alloactinosynnema sp. L-07]
MSIQITAKVICQSKQAHGEDEVSLTFQADYEDGRNKEWAKYTPSMSISTTMRGSVGDHFEPGKSYLLTFTPEEV